MTIGENIELTRRFIGFIYLSGNRSLPSPNSNYLVQNKNNLKIIISKSCFLHTKTVMGRVKQVKSLDYVGTWEFSRLNPHLRLEVGGHTAVTSGNSCNIQLYKSFDKDGAHPG